MDLFYIIRDGKLEYGFDFTEMVLKYRDQISFNRESEKFFQNNTLLRPGETFFKEIKRLRVGEAILIRDDDTFEFVSLPVKKWEVNENLFKKGLIEYIKLQKPENGNEYLLFSGGRDSALLALLMSKEIGIKMHYLTEIPGNMDDGGGYDSKLSFFSKVLKTNIEQVTMDYNEYAFEDIEYLVEKMPLTAHISVGFDCLNRYVANHGGRPWTGQDADAMYCLGFSGNRLLDILSRYYLSDRYIKSLDDVNGKTASRVIGKLIAKSGSRKIGRKFREARNINELRNCIVERYSTVPILEIERNGKIEKLDENVSILEAKHLLWQDKVSYYVTARDHRVAAYAGKCEQSTQFPYSSTMMYLIQVNLKRGIKEVLSNKHLISYWIEYYIGKKDFRRLYPENILQNYTTIMKYESDILKSTNFGKSLRKISGYKGDNIYLALALAWEKALMERLDMEW